MKIQLVAAIIVNFVTSSTAQAEITAIILYDRGKLGDDFVRAKTVERIEKGNVSVLIFSSGEKETIPNRDVVELMLIPDLKRNRTIDHEFQEIIAFVGELEIRKNRYPLSRDVLEKVQAFAQTYVQGYENGLVFVEGNWQRKEVMQAGNTEAKAAGGGGTSIKMKDGSEKIVKRISSVTNDGIMVVSDTGVSKISFSEIDAEFAKKHGYESMVVSGSHAKSEQSPPVNLTIGFIDKNGEVIQRARVNMRPSEEDASLDMWRPNSLGDVAKCVVIIKGDSGSGTGFVCNQDGISYIYTNAHVIAGNKTIQIYDRDGNVIEDIIGFELAEAPFGGGKDFSSGDLARITLANRRVVALEFSGRTDELTESSSIAAIGNSEGANIIVTLEGIITGIGPDALEVSADIVQGNSGGPVVDAETFSVIGVATFLKRGVESVWSRDTRFEGVRRFALRTDKSVQWKSVPIFSFLRECYLVDTLQKDIRLLGLLNLLDFKVNGVDIDEDLSVEGEYLVGDIISENREHPLVRSLLKLNSVLGSDSSSVDDVFHHYVTYLSEGGRAMAENRRKVEEMEFCFYNRNIITRLEVLEQHDQNMKTFSDLVAALRKHL